MTILVTAQTGVLIGSAAPPAFSLDTTPEPDGYMQIRNFPEVPEPETIEGLSLEIPPHTPCASLLNNGSPSDGHEMLSTKELPEQELPPRPYAHRP